MNKENLTFTTARGSTIPLEYPIKFHTIYPALWAMNLTSVVKEDERFNYIETVMKEINGYNIEYCKASISTNMKYKDEQYIHDEYCGKICYFTMVTSANESLKDSDLEPLRRHRAVIIPENINDIIG